MYPFNAIWALARIGGEKSKKILSENIKKDPETIQQALEDIQLREKYNRRNFGVFWQGTQDLYDKLDEN